MNMHLVYLGATLAMIITMLLTLIRSTLGPTVYDRILALNAFGTKTVLLIVLCGYLFGRPEWLDLAITYVLLNFIGTLAVLRFSKYGSLARVDRDPEGHELTDDKQADNA